MKKAMVAAVMAAVANSVFAGPLADASKDTYKMAALADASTGGAGLPSLESKKIDTGLAVAPTIGGAVVSSDVNATASSIKQQGVLATLSNFISDYPKTTGAAVGIPLGLIAYNNRQHLGFGSNSSSSGQANGNSATDNSVHVQVSNNSGPTTVVVQSPTITKGQ